MSRFSPLNDDSNSLQILPAALALEADSPFVVIVRTRDEFSHWLKSTMPGLMGIQVEHLLGDAEVWALAAQGADPVPLDVVLSDPATEFSALYRLVDVRIVRPVRVTVPALPGLLKAVRLAASLQLSVRVLPGQPGTEVLSELNETMQFYLHDPMVEAPVEFFHSLLAAFRGLDNGTLWTFLEQDPALFQRLEYAGFPPALPPDFIETHLAQLLESNAECAHCRWRPVCAGYFKFPDPHYPCDGVKSMFGTLESAADEISRDLESMPSQGTA